MGARPAAPGGRVHGAARRCRWPRRPHPAQRCVLSCADPSAERTTVGVRCRRNLHRSTSRHDRRAPRDRERLSTGSQRGVADALHVGQGGRPTGVPPSAPAASGRQVDRRHASLTSTTLALRSRASAVPSILPNALRAAQHPALFNTTGPCVRAEAVNDVAQQPVRPLSSPACRWSVAAARGRLLVDDVAGACWRMTTVASWTSTNQVSITHSRNR